MSTAATLPSLGTAAALPALGAAAPLGGSTAASPAQNSATSASAATGPSWLNGTVAQISVILLGLLLIGAGIFSFDKTRTIVIGAAKAGAALAA